ncbi:hypothetical protein HDF16_004610 [Granulicella aggregans]|uniref:DUF2029 domain-containing protein n=1 Tax=Granulicella aggregans TaxID=474949 RepID=A0A7W8E5Q9_9BACT|nr:glycosyltransferase family 87 protein [Granulicella aggregans]MBB5059881.1 hypothetical protein [Granulicella aggregans]
MRNTRVLLVLALLFFLGVPGLGLLNVLHRPLDFRDYHTVYADAQSLVQGYDPYLDRQTQIDQAAERAKGMVGPLPRPGNWLMAQYPPPSLAYFVPLSYLPWKASLATWLIISTILFGLAAFSVLNLYEANASLWPQLLLVVFVAGSIGLPRQGQPSTAAISLAVIAMCSFIKNRRIGLGACCLALAITLKPQVAILFLPYMFFMGSRLRKYALAVIAMVAVFSIPGFLLIHWNPASGNWLGEMLTNIRLAGTNGLINDPAPANVDSQSLMETDTIFYTFIRSAHVATILTEAFCGCLLLVFALLLLRTRTGFTRDRLGVATLSVLSLLPLHHRAYDIGILILIFPALDWLTRQSSVLKYISTAMTLGVIILSHYPLPHILHVSYGSVASVGLIRFLLVFRTMALFLVALSLFFLMILGLWSRRRLPGENLQITP